MAMISFLNRGVRVMLYSDKSGNSLMLNSSPVRGIVVAVSLATQRVRNYICLSRMIVHF
jgi:hypothetical protein